MIGEIPTISRSRMAAAKFTSTTDNLKAATARSVGAIVSDKNSFLTQMLDDAAVNLSSIGFVTFLGSERQRVGAVGFEIQNQRVNCSRENL